MPFLVVELGGEDECLMGQECYIFSCFVLFWKQHVCVCVLFIFSLYCLDEPVQAVTSCSHIKFKSTPIDVMTRMLTIQPNTDNDLEFTYCCRDMYLC